MLYPRHARHARLTGSQGVSSELDWLETPFVNSVLACSQALHARGPYELPR